MTDDQFQKFTRYMDDSIASLRAEQSQEFAQFREEQSQQLAQSREEQRKEFAQFREDQASELAKSREEQGTLIAELVDEFTKHIDDSFTQFENNHFKKITKYVDASIAPLKEEIESINTKIDDIYKTQDFMLSELRDISNELGFHIKQTDETLDDHTERISKLELAIG